MAVAEPPPMDYCEENLDLDDDEVLKDLIVPNVLSNKVAPSKDDKRFQYENVNFQEKSTSTSVNEPLKQPNVAVLDLNDHNEFKDSLFSSCIEEEKENQKKPNSLPVQQTDHQEQNSFKPPLGFKQVEHALPFSKHNIHSESHPANPSGDISIEVSDSKKVGENVSAYIVYKVITKTSMPAFHKMEMEVYRRFSDFLGLHEKLFEKHSREGRFIPVPPEKNFIGMAKVKVSKEISGSSEFVERRRILLEKFLKRISDHPHLRSDPSFVDFLETEGDLVRSTGTSALSGAGVLRLFQKVGDTFNKATYKMEEIDEWFDTKTNQLITIENVLTSVHAYLEDMVYHNKELSQNTGLFSKSISQLVPIEENEGLTKVLNLLSQVWEDVDVSHCAQEHGGCQVLLDFIKDYMGVIQSAKDALNERTKLYKIWKENEVTLARKREAKVRMELAHKSDKLFEASREIAEWEQITEKSEEDFEKISRNIKDEMSRLNINMVKEFKEAFILFLESVLTLQTKIIKSWESFLPEAQSIT